ncbi:MAG: hypothetical protein KDK33_20545 [Leptospiraceae bacterium]|nr:hypothetical protein [Leptospiraceae bacterium]
MKPSLRILLFTIVFSTLQCASANGPLIDSLLEKDLVTARQLARESPDFDKMGACFNALMVAAATGDRETVKILLERGMDPNIRSPICYSGNGYDPGTGAMTALRLTSDPEIARMLIAAGADVDIPNNDGGTALSNSLYYGAIDLAWVLIRSGANLNGFDLCGNNRILKSMNAGNKYETRPRQARPEDWAELQSYIIARARPKFRSDPVKTSDALDLPGEQITAIYSGKDYDLTPVWKSKFPNKDWSGSESIALPEMNGRLVLHKSEFVWTSTGENLWTWSIKRNISMDPLRGKRSKCN